MSKPYSTKFTARGTPRRYLLSGIPPTLWEKARAKAKREGLSMRAMLLTLVDAWLKEPGGEAEREAPEQP